jgi:hypothetical protein
MALSEKEKAEKEYSLALQLSKAKYEYNELKSKEPKTKQDIAEIINKLDEIVHLHGLLQNMDEWERLIYEFAEWHEKKGELRMAKQILPPDRKRAIRHYKLERRKMGLEEFEP